MKKKILFGVVFIMIFLIIGYTSFRFINKDNYKTQSRDNQSQIEPSTTPEIIDNVPAEDTTEDDKTSDGSITETETKDNDTNDNSTTETEIKDNQNVSEEKKDNSHDKNETPAKQPTTDIDNKADNNSNAIVDNNKDNETTNNQNNSNKSENTQENTNETPFPNNENNTEETQQSETKEPSVWDSLGISEYDYYNKPMYVWDRVDFSIDDYGTREATEQACREQSKKLFEEGIGSSCSTVNSYSGRYLGECLKTF